MAEDLQIQLQETPQANAAETAAARKFQYHIEAPPQFEGAEQPPNPAEYLLKSYAGVLHIVAQLVAEEQNLDLGGLSITVEGELNPARLLGTDGNQRAGFQDIELHLHTGHTFPPDRKQAFLAAVKARCPFTDNLRNRTPLRIALEQPEFEPTTAPALI
jgi:uncharacterized OsmC-like protein